MITSTITVLILVPVFFEMIKKRALRRGAVIQGQARTCSHLAIKLGWFEPSKISGERNRKRSLGAWT